VACDIAAAALAGAAFVAMVLGPVGPCNWSQPDRLAAMRHTEAATEDVPRRLIRTNPRRLSSGNQMW
jgi:hypothetical protein